MKTTKFLVLAAVAMTFAACSNDDEVVNDGPVAAQISAGVNVPGTRANDNQWEADEIGVRVTNAPNSNMEELYKNVKYTTNTSGTGAAYFSAPQGEGIFFQDTNERVTFAAYGPYQESAADALPGTDGVILGSTANQSTRELQKAFDYIYASGAEASRSVPTVAFQDNSTFAHKMTRLIIIVQTSTQDGFTAGQVADGTYTLSGLNHNGQFDVTTGTAIATGTATTEDWSLSNNSLKTETAMQVTFTSILYPQELGSALIFKAVIDGQTYVNNTAIKPALEAEHSYTYTITVKKTGLTVGGCTINQWGDGDTGSGDATME